MKKQGADTNNVIESQSKMTFCHTENFLKFNVKQEDIIKCITSEVSCSRFLITRGWESITFEFWILPQSKIMFYNYKWNCKGLDIYNFWSLANVMPTYYFNQKYI